MGSLMREFAKVTPAVALANLGTYSYNLSKEIIARIDGWGINLESAQIKSIVFHRDLFPKKLIAPASNYGRFH